jgi:purine-nucleoside phosphorylase
MRANAVPPENLPEAFTRLQPKWGIILGSGLNPLVDTLEVVSEISYGQVPGIPSPGVAGHAGRFALVRIKGVPAVIAQGRVHLYEKHSAAEVTAGVRFLAGIGVRQLILTNAAGTANPDFSPGAWMMLRDHLNLTGTTPLLGGPNFVDLTQVYSERLRREFLEIAGREKILLHEGIYAGLVGPQYETPAEVRMLRGLGADAIGMSTVLEAIQARALGLEVAAFSCLTNWGAGLGNGELSHTEVLETGRGAVAELQRLLDSFFEKQLVKG